MKGFLICRIAFPQPSYRITSKWTAFIWRLLKKNCRHFATAKQRMLSSLFTSKLLIIIRIITFARSPFHFSMTFAMVRALLFPSLSIGMVIYGHRKWFMSLIWWNRYFILDFVVRKNVLALDVRSYMRFTQHCWSQLIKIFFLSEFSKIREIDEIVQHIAESNIIQFDNWEQKIWKFIHSDIRIRKKPQQITIWTEFFRYKKYSWWIRVCFFFEILNGSKTQAKQPANQH